MILLLKEYAQYKNRCRFFLYFLFLLQIHISNNTYFKSVFGQNILKTTSITTGLPNSLLPKSTSQDIQKIKVGDITMAYKKFKR